ncbi:COMM domain-containing protein 6 isoform X2 [Lingula anatina]|uniref:COMM domain-containing protein 6 n=1 Tax=Lingula anatina TaxID=7574 RepID=A0A1S3JRY7_LINAN|nr:COMM domain-containing protein 6 isoform X2 [Lingula anatina]|eukprot:XP_013412764.1 COMM domain-containing protein 6 isoform X2 [Lingula anatina]
MYITNATSFTCRTAVPCCFFMSVRVPPWYCHVTCFTPSHDFQCYKMSASILHQAPQGFYGAVEIINKLPQDVLAEMCHEVMQFLQYKIGSINVKALHNKSLVENEALTEKAIQSSVNALTYLFRAAARLKYSTAELTSQLQSSSAFSESAQATLKHIWNQQGKLLFAVDQANQLINVGQLIDFQWKLGVAMSSDGCRNLNTPFVTVLLKVADPTGHVTTRSFEMTVIQFQNFSKQIKEMAAVLESV